MSKYLCLEVEPGRLVRMSPHRFGQVGNLFIFESKDWRLDLHLTDGELRIIRDLIDKRLNVKAA